MPDELAGTRGAMPDKGKPKELGGYKNTAFRLCLAGILLVLIIIYIISKFVYPDTEIIPTDFFFAVAIAQMFLMWLDGIREKTLILWADRQKNDLAEMKSKFTMITSHELMTPIAVIKGYLGLLNDGLMGPLTNDQKQALDTITRHVTRLEQLKSTLSNLYVSTQAITLRELKPSSLQELIRVTADDALPLVKKRNLSLVTEVDEKLLPVTIDAAEIRHVLMSIILNSIRFTPDGGRIVIRARDAGDDIRIEVEDNGVGIRKEKIPVIFDGFYEIGDTTQHHSGGIEFRSGGLGLGLTIAKNIIESYKGKIWAESDPGKFTKVMFTLPK